MRFQFKNRRWFYKHVLSYLVLLLVTLVIINGWFGRKINTTYQEEVVARLTTDILSMRDTLDHELLLLFNTANQFRLLQNVENFHFEEDPLQANLIKTALATFTITNRLLSDIAYVPFNQDYVLTGSTTSTSKLFTEDVYVSTSFTPDQFLNRLRNLQSFKTFPIRFYKNEEGLAIAIPQISDYGKTSGICLFYIRNSTLEAMILNQLSKYNAQLEIRDNEDTLLFTSKPTSFMASKDDITLTIRSNIAPWTFIVRVAREQALLDSLNRLSKMQQMSTLVAICFVSILIFFFATINYKPIKRLQKLAGDLTFGPSDGSKSKGEFEEIENTLALLKYQNTDLASKLERSKSSEANIALQDLLSGRYKHLEDFNTVAAELSLEFFHSQFFVACILIQETNRDIDELAQLFHEELPDDLNCFYVLTPIPDQIYFINSIPDSYQSKIPEVYETMRDSVEANTGLNITVGLGSVVEGTALISQSFLEARTALDYRFVRGKNTTIVFSEVAKSISFSTTFPNLLLDQLKIALQASDIESIEELTKQLTDFLSQESIPLFLAKTLSFSAINLFFEHLPASSTIIDSQNELFVLSDFETVDEVIEALQSVKNRFIHLDKPAYRQNAELLLHEAIAYIKKHGFECGFTMQHVADHVSLQLPNLSLMFKEHTHITPLDYVTSLRLDAAKRLLEETDLPLKDISLQVGYYNISSFIRRFKQLNGITPGDYRKIRTHTPQSLYHSEQEIG